MSEHAFCPVCGSSSEAVFAPGGADKNAYDCIRCGRYEVSRTALVPLEEKYKDDKILRARLSHAIRKASLVDKKAPVLITTNVLKDFIERALPEPEQQADNLLLAVADMLGEDRHGTVKFDEEMFASYAGVVDPEDVNKLVHYLETEKLVTAFPQPIDRRPGAMDRRLSDIGVTVKGWKRCQKVSPKPALEELTIEQSQSETEANIVGEKDALHHFMEKDSDGLLTLREPEENSDIRATSALSPETIAEVTNTLIELIAAIEQDNSSMQRVLKDQLIATLEATLQELKAPYVEVSRLRRLAKMLEDVSWQAASDILKQHAKSAASALAAAAATWFITK